MFTDYPRFVPGKGFAHISDQDYRARPLNPEKIDKGFGWRTKVTKQEQKRFENLCKIYQLLKNGGIKNGFNSDSY